MNETETLTLPASGKQVVLKGYVTGFVDQEVRKVLMAGNQASYEVDTNSIDSNNPGEMPQNGKMVMHSDPTAAIKADNKLLELMVVSVEGDNTDVLNKLMALPVQDVNYVTAKVKSLQAASEVSEATKKA